MIMNLTKTLCRIQYQTARLEVIEFIFSRVNNPESQMAVEMAYNMIFTLRQSLFSASEACLDASRDTLKYCVDSLQHTLVDATSLLIETSGGLTGEVLFHELFNSIILELVSLNSELSDVVLGSDPFVDSSYQQSSPSLVKTEPGQNFKNLVTKCMGDSQKAERLIKYEYQQNSALDREGAILSAIMRWENDNR